MGAARLGALRAGALLGARSLRALGLGLGLGREFTVHGAGGQVVIRLSLSFEMNSLSFQIKFHSFYYSTTVAPTDGLDRMISSTFSMILLLAVILVIQAPLSDGSMPVPSVSGAQRAVSPSSLVFPLPTKPTDTETAAAAETESMNAASPGLLQLIDYAIGPVVDTNAWGAAYSVGQFLPTAACSVCWYLCWLVALFVFAPAVTAAIWAIIQFFLPYIRAISSFVSVVVTNGLRHMSLHTRPGQWLKEFQLHLEAETLEIELNMEVDLR